MKKIVLIGVLFLISTGLFARGIVFQTGQNSSFYTGDDGTYQKGIAPDFTLYSASGDEVIRDNNTGLIWQADFDNNFGYAPDGTTPQIVHNNAVSYCQALVLGGFSDWRLPEYFELNQIIDYGISSTSVPSAFVATTVSDYYWSNTDFGNDADFAIAVYFGGGSVHGVIKSTSYYARCVRGNIEAPTPYFRTGGTVSDVKNGLVWQDDYDDNPATLSDIVFVASSWQAAIDYCETAQMLGSDSWRLPNLKELESLFDEREFNPAINTVFVHTESFHYWSSTTLHNSTSSAWSAKMTDLLEIGFGKSASTIKVVCVHDGFKSSYMTPVISYLLH